MLLSAKKMSNAKMLWQTIGSSTYEKCNLLQLFLFVCLFCWFVGFCNRANHTFHNVNAKEWQSNLTFCLVFRYCCRIFYRNFKIEIFFLLHADSRERFCITNSLSMQLKWNPVKLNHFQRIFFHHFQRLFLIGHDRPWLCLPKINLFCSLKANKQLKISFEYQK